MNTHPIPKQNLVRRFMEHFGQQVPEKKELPNENVQFIRAMLIHEELVELGESRDLVAYLDAVCDLLYVVYGAAAEAGFNSDTIDQAFLEVHRSNMSKLWTHQEKVQHEVDAEIASLHLGTNQHNITFEPRFDKWIAKRGGKVIKSPSYSPAQLERYCQ